MTRNPPNDGLRGAPRGRSPRRHTHTPFHPLATPPPTHPKAPGKRPWCRHGEATALPRQAADAGGRWAGKEHHWDPASPFLRGRWGRGTSDRAPYQPGSPDLAVPRTEPVHLVGHPHSFLKPLAPRPHPSPRATLHSPFPQGATQAGRSSRHLLAADGPGAFRRVRKAERQASPTCTFLRPAVFCR